MAAIETLWVEHSYKLAVAGITQGGPLSPVLLQLQELYTGDLAGSWVCDPSASLTLKHRETHGCVVSTAATDALVLKHQVISIHNAD